jgi:hypothetical protein
MYINYVELNQNLRAVARPPVLWDPARARSSSDKFDSQALRTVGRPLFSGAAYL